MNGAPTAAGLTLILVLIVAPSCGDDGAGRAVLLGGKRISVDRLARGHRLYDRYCATCHGEKGDGLGPAATFSSPPPRDFRTAEFKFAPAIEGELPTDEDIAQVMRRGLTGTAMRAWDIPDSELAPIIDYIKTFSPPDRGFRDRARRQLRPRLPPDPFADRGEAGRATARSDGARLYHAEFQCHQCHPAYASDKELAAWRARPREIDPHDSVPKWSATYRSVLLPPDFRRHPMRFARTTAELYRIIAYGMRGPMPAYGHLGSDQIWAVAHYVGWLAQQRP